MRKIKTIFERNWDTDRKVNQNIDVNFDFNNAIATEKLDGMNVRVTVRNATSVRLEKRRNPSRIQKQNGIVDPWYVDAIEGNPEDKWLFDALQNTDLTGVPDGEWSGEALGKNIQGNPLNLDHHTIFFFSLPAWRERIIFEDVPTSFEGLQAWLPQQKSKIGNDAPIEGIVWHGANGDMVKIKRKDFY